MADGNCLIFSSILRRNGEHLLKEDNRARALEITRGLLRCPKISWTLVHKWLKTGPEFLPTFTILFCPCPSHTLYAALTWRHTATLNETALDSSAAQIWSPKRCYVGDAIAIVAIFSNFRYFRHWVKCSRNTTRYDRRVARLTCAK